MQLRTLFFLIILAAIGYVLYTVWPTPYEITTDGKVTIRTNRMTGEQQLKTASGWKSLEKKTNIRPGDRYGEETGIKNAVK